MTRKTIDAALTAIDTFYGNQSVDADGEQVPWEQALPKRAEWIIGRFCSSSRMEPNTEQCCLCIGDAQMDGRHGTWS